MFDSVGEVLQGRRGEQPFTGQSRDKGIPFETEEREKLGVDSILRPDLAASGPYADSSW